MIRKLMCATTLALLAGCQQEPPPASNADCLQTTYAAVQPADLLVSADDGSMILTVWRDPSGVIRVLEATKARTCEIYTGTDTHGALPL